MLQVRVVALVFSQPTADTIQVISLRKALNHERARYEKLLREQLG
jgi:uncharacterized DUF497 family protein